MFEYFWCRSCGLFSSQRQVARFTTIDEKPYMCPGCVPAVDGVMTILPGTNELRPWPDCRDDNPSLPERPIVGVVYPLTGSVD